MSFRSNGRSEIGTASVHDDSFGAPDLAFYLTGRTRSGDELDAPFDVSWTVFTLMQGAGVWTMMTNHLDLPELEPFGPRKLWA